MASGSCCRPVLRNRGEVSHGTKCMRGIGPCFWEQAGLQVICNLIMGSLFISPITDSITAVTLCFNGYINMIISVC